MLYKPLKQTLEMQITSFQAFTINPFIEQILANQIPSFETPETKRRRQEEFQAALVHFCKNKLEFEKVWHQYTQHLKNQIEEDAMRDEKIYRERQIQGNKEIEKRSPIIPIDKEKQKEQDEIFQTLIEKAIHYVSIQIQKLDELINELSNLEKSIRHDTDERLKKVKHAYQLMANTDASITIKYTYPIDDQDRNEQKIFKIHIADILTFVNDNIPDKSTDESVRVVPNEKELIEQFVDKQLEGEGEGEKFKTSAQVVAIKKEVELKVQEHKAQHPENEALQINLAIIETNQADAIRVKEMKGCVISFEEKLKQRKAALLQRQASSAPKQSNANINLSTELTNPEKSIMKACHSTINEVTHNREKIALVDQPRIEKTAANSPTFPDEQSRLKKP